MTPEPQLALVVAMVMAVAWTMFFGGLRKHLLERKRPVRVCPSCGRTIAGRVCDGH